ncbi:MAG: glycosyltransferase family 2 protein [Lysobacterales bacterium]
MSSHRVSIVIPTRNRLDKLRRTLASVNQQTFRDFEVWLVNDGSTDGTREFLDTSLLSESFPNIPSFNILVNERCRGAAAARNQALVGSCGDVIAFLDDDDVWLPNYLEQQVFRLDLHPEAMAICAQYIEFDREGRCYAPDLAPLFEYKRPLVHHLTESLVHTMSTLVCRRKAFDHIGLLEETCCIVHDWEWCARLLISGNSIIKAEGPALAKREIPGGLVARYRTWYAEEQGVLDQIFNQHPEYSEWQSQVRAHRALWFARIGLVQKDYAFAAHRFADAVGQAPLRSMNIILRRLARSRTTRLISAHE